jgi:ABC-type multidrug transport system fused ATPase/permease subunit
LNLIAHVRQLFAIASQPIRWRLFALLVVMVLAAVLEVAGIGAIFPLFQVMLEPAQLKRIAAFHPAFTEMTLRTFLIGACVLILATFAAKTVTVLLASWLKWRVQGYIYRQLSVTLFRSYIRSPLSFHARNRGSDLLRNLTSHVAHTSQYGFLGVVDFAADALTCAAIFLLLAFVQPVVSLLALATVASLSMIYVRIGHPYFLQWGKALSAASGRVYRMSLEPMIGIKTIKVLGREGYFEEHYERAVSDYASVSAKNAFQSTVPRQLLEIVAVFALVGIILWTVIKDGNLAALVAVLALFAAAVYRMAPAVVRMTTSLQNFGVAREAIDVVYAHISQAAGPASDTRPRIEAFTRDLVLESATFYYEGMDKPAIDDVDLVIRRGETVAFVGQSGAGKTTLADIILGLQGLDSGRMVIDGVVCTDPALVRRGIFGYVPQDTFLIDDTVRRNIALGIPDRDIDEAGVRRAIAAAAIEKVVADLPQGLDTVVGDRGLRLSGGQRQRIGIARAMYEDPEILVLDEATSSIDTTTEAEISDAVNRLRGRKTVIVIAHRLSTVRECDRVIFLKNGRLVDQGSFDDLVLINGDFAAMVRQMGGEQGSLLLPRERRLRG